MNIRKAILWRVNLAFLFFALFGIVIVVKIVHIQNVEGAMWRSMADSLTTRYHNIEPIRGNIYSEDGSLLVTSLPVYEARMDFRADGLDEARFMRKVDSLAWCLSDYFGDKTPERWQDDLLHAYNQGQRYFLIKRNITHKQIKEIRKYPIFRQGQFGGGFIVQQKSKRMKPFKELAHRTLGYKRPGVMPVGLEGAYDQYLSGESGKRLMQKVAGGTWVPVNADNELEPDNGKDIVSTLNVDIQDITEQALQRCLTRHNAHHGSAIVMEVETGEVKAIANLGRAGEDTTFYENYNYAIGEGTEPGSTFKLASVIALLESGLFHPEDSIDTEGGRVWYYDRVMRDDKTNLGRLSLKDAFRLSSNVAISKAVMKAFGDQPQRFVDYLRNMQLHKPLDIPIAGEGMPYIKEPGMKDWSGTTLPWMSIGYELRMTPLQVLNLYNTVANDGYPIKPKFASEVRQVGKTLERFPTQESKKRICGRQTLQSVQDMLVSVVERGTARGIKPDRYVIAGKTGTALVATDDGYGKEKVYQASFVGYFPAQDPRYSCIVVVNGPQRGGFYGSQVAAPVFRQIADQLYALAFDMHRGTRIAQQPVQAPFPQKAGPFHQQALTQMALEFKWPLSSKEEEKLHDPTSQWVKVQSDTLSIASARVLIDDHTVPDVRGMGISDALYVLENSGLRVMFYGSGTVHHQSIAPGKRVVNNAIIQLELE